MPPNPANQFEVVSSGATKANFTHASSNKTSLYIESDDTSARIGSTYYGSGGAFKPLQFLNSLLFVKSNCNPRQIPKTGLPEFAYFCNASNIFNL